MLVYECERLSTAALNSEKVLQKSLRLTINMMCRVSCVKCETFGRPVKIHIVPSCFTLHAHDAPVRPAQPHGFFVRENYVENRI